MKRKIIVQIERKIPMKAQRIFLPVMILITLLAVALRPAPARAADAVVGSGTPASCTEAAFDIALTIASSGAPSTITFNCGPAGHTLLFSAPKNINTGSITIDGDGRIMLDGQNSARLFFANDGVTLRFEDIYLIGGNSVGGGGGAIEAFGAFISLDHTYVGGNQATTTGGAITCTRSTDGTLDIIDSVLEGNNAQSGGAVYNDGCVMTVNRSTLRGNQAGGAGGAIHNAMNSYLRVNHSRFEVNTALDGPGIYNAGGATTVIETSTLENNAGGYGGGVENSGTLTMTSSLVNLNNVTGSGGGLWNLGGQMYLKDITVSNNSASEGGGVNSYGSHVRITNANIVGNIATTSHGGGIYIGSGTLFVVNATISGNQAGDSAANGGGIFHKSDDNLTLDNVTLADNQAGLFGGGLYHFGRYAVVTNATFANNLAGAAGSAVYEDSPMTPAEPGVVQMANSLIFGAANNCDGGLFQSLGHNISQGTCSSLADASDQNNYSGDLLLGPLTYNGGAFHMHTILPQTGSPLVNAGDSVQCLSSDQRGAARVGVCDIGAVESGAKLPRLYLPLVQK